MLSKLTTGALGTLTLAGALVFHQGIVDVKVHQKRPGGDNVRIMVPGAILSLAVMAVPGEVIRRHAAHARQALPAARIAAQELEKCPDTVLVEVQERDEHVRIEKRGGDLIVDVNSPRETVHVSIPLRTLRFILREVEAASPAS